MKKRMKKETALFFIRKYPVKPLVDLALSFVNLTEQEEIVINLCGKKQLTQEAAADKLGVSKNSVYTWFSEAMEKLCYAWGNSEWIEILADYISQVITTMSEDIFLLS